MSVQFLIGLVLIVVSSAAFGLSGALAKGLLDTGWSPAAAVVLRTAIGATALLVPAVHAMRGRWHVLRRGWPSIVMFGVFAVGACQLTYFLAVQRISVGIALLLEYCAVILIVGWLWLRHGQRPKPFTVAGTGVAMAGLVLMLGVFGALNLDPLGIMWGLLSAVGLAVFFVVAADVKRTLPPVALACGGLLVGTLLLLLAGAVGLVPMAWNTQSVALAGFQVPWWTDMVTLGVVASAIACLTGIAGTRELGSKLASFLGLSEVLFAVLWAWLLLAQIPTSIQLVGGALVLAGIVVVKFDDTRGRVRATASRQQ